jgi:aerobic-type carbon monoxide dehydrogenase small subunit (CoxS/CutS family)
VAIPSIVVMARPSTWIGSTRQLSSGFPSTSTVHVPHSPSSQPCLVPVSCLVLPIQVEGRAITTIEGMATGSDLHPLQQAFAELGAAQCGYCTPGILLAAKSLLESGAHPSRDEIREALAGNLCRCTGYSKILDAVQLAAERMT